MKITLRQRVRTEVGALIRREHAEAEGVLTVTGLTKVEMRLERLIHHYPDPDMVDLHQTISTD